jgi:4-hydroxyacetophenone monooxygenase
MKLALGQEVPEENFGQRKAAASFADFPAFLARWTDGKPASLPPDFNVAIIGSGHSGIGMGIQLGLLGIPYDIYERRGEIGGVWSINRYPDIRVDTMSCMFQLGFVKRYPWTEYFSRGAEIRQYMTDMARDFGAYEHIHFSHNVKLLQWNESTSRWELEIAHGDETIYTTASAVIAATGLFSNAKKLDVPGIDNFTGDVIHTTEWPDDYVVAGKTVAVVGNGSSGVQLLSRLAEDAKQVYVYVRTPQWITPQIYYGDPITPEFQWLLQTMPYYWNWDRFVWITPSDSRGGVHVIDPEWKAKGGLFSQGNDELRERLTRYIKEQTGYREDLYSRLIPHYVPWARRMIVDNNWYKTLTEDHVELVTDPIEHVDANGIVTVDGKHRDIDLIVAATGFNVAKYLYPIEVRGRGGVSLEQIWEEHPAGPRAFWSITVPGFQNLFIMYGPNSQGGAGAGISDFLQLWATYIAGLLVQLIEAGAKELEVKEDVFEEHNRELDERTSKLIWMDPDSRDRNYFVYRGRVQAMTGWTPAEHWDAMVHPRLDRDFNVK